MLGQPEKSAHGLFHEDRRLLERFRAGESLALAEVYVRCYSAAQRVIVRGFSLRGHARYVAGVGEPWVREELLQEAFARAFSESGRRGFDGGKPYLPYLLQIVRNVRIDGMRCSWRYVLASESAPLDGDSLSEFGAAVRHFSPAKAEPALPSPEEQLDRCRERRALLSCLARLDRQSQHFVALRFFEELSQCDTARAMGIGRGRVRSLERRVLGQVQRWCESWQTEACLPADVPA